MIGRAALVAKREYLTTVGSKGFLFGLLIMPVFFVLLALLVPRLLNAQRPQIQAEVAVIDRSGGALDELRAAFDPRAIAARMAAGNRGGMPARNASPPVLTLAERPGNADIETGKEWLLIEEKERVQRAIVVVHPDAVERQPGAEEFGSYDLYISAGLRDAAESAIRDSVRQALIGARLKASGLEPSAIQAAMRVSRANATIVAATGEQKAQRGFNRMLPFAFGMLLFIGVMTSGQTLMTSMVEEKSSRVVEVLLAAVSPLELMWGKLLGQLGVGLTIMSVYIGLGILGLSQFQMLGLLDPTLVVYLFVFFVITYLVFGAVMLAIGAAVNQMADAQTLMGPVMMLLVAPYVLAFFIGQAPNSALSIALSFIPPVNSFVILARLASDTPPPVWQVQLSMLVGIAAAVAAVWFAAKTFRIGLLMHGKPPNFATLVRWARMA